MHSSRMCTDHTLTGGVSARGVSAWGGVCPGGVCPGGVSAQRGVSARGGVCPGGVCPGECLPRGGWGVCLPRGDWGVCLPRGVCPCDLSHHAIDVTCMLPPHQLRHINSAPAYILLPGHVTCKACWATNPPPPTPPHGQIDTCKNITFANYVCGR